MRWPAIAISAASPCSLRSRENAPPMLAGEQVDEPEARVVTGGFVFRPRIAEADDQVDWRSHVRSSSDPVRMIAAREIVDAAPLERKGRLAAAFRANERTEPATLSSCLRPCRPSRRVWRRPWRLPSRLRLRLRLRPRARPVPVRALRRPASRSRPVCRFPRRAAG